MVGVVVRAASSISILFSLNYHSHKLAAGQRPFINFFFVSGHGCQRMRVRSKTVSDVST
jgi:hypothetical protein